MLKLGDGFSHNVFFVFILGIGFQFTLLGWSSAGGFGAIFLKILSFPIF